MLHRPLGALPGARGAGIRLNHFAACPARGRAWPGAAPPPQGGRQPRGCTGTTARAAAEHRTLRGPPRPSVTPPRPPRAGAVHYLSNVIILARVIRLESAPPSRRLT